MRKPNISSCDNHDSMSPAICPTTRTLERTKLSIGLPLPHRSFATSPTSFELRPRWPKFVIINSKHTNGTLFPQFATKSQGNMLARRAMILYWTSFLTAFVSASAGPLRVSLTDCGLFGALIDTARLLAPFAFASCGGRCCCNKHDVSNPECYRSWLTDVTSPSLAVPPGKPPVQCSFGNIG